jgi:hypothetical protein
LHEHNRDRARRLTHRLQRRAAIGDDHIRGKGQQLRGIFARTIGVAGSKAIVDPEIASLAPSKHLERLPQRVKSSGNFGIILGQAHDDAEAPHLLALLRTRRQRPRGRAADERDELAPCDDSCPGRASVQRERRAGTQGDAMWPSS